MVLPGEGDKLSSTKGPWDGAAVTGQWTRSLPGVLGEAKEARAQGMEGSSVWAVESQRLVGGAHEWQRTPKIQGTRGNPGISNDGRAESGGECSPVT